MEELLDPEAAAKVLGIRTITVYKWVTERKIPFLKVGGAAQIPAVGARCLVKRERTSPTARNALRIFRDECQGYGPRLGAVSAQRWRASRYVCSGGFRKRRRRVLAVKRYRFSESLANGTVERSTPMTSALLDAALTHVAHGRAVIAVTKNKTPYHKGWNAYFTRRQSEEELNREFSNGAHGIAMVLWPACPYVVLDFDGPHAEEAWQKMNIELPATARNRTQSGGTHLFFKIPPKLKFEIKRKIRLVKATCSCPKTCGVDLLIYGYAVLPPTPGYEEDPDYPLEDAVVIPSGILALAQAKPLTQKRSTGDSDGRVRQGERHNVACSLAGTMRARHMSIKAIRAALKADNEERFDPPLSDNEIESVIKSAARWAEDSTVVFEHCTDLGNARRLVISTARYSLFKQ